MTASPPLWPPAGHWTMIRSDSGRRRGGLLSGFSSNRETRLSCFIGLPVFVLLVFQLGVGGAKDEHLAVLLVAGMEGKGGDAAVPVQEEVFAGIGVVGWEAVDPASVLGDQQALGVGVLGDEDGVLEGVLGEDSLEVIPRRGVRVILRRGRWSRGCGRSGRGGDFPGLWRCGRSLTAPKWRSG